MLGLGVARDHDWAAVSKLSIPQMAHSVRHRSQSSTGQGTMRRAMIQRKNPEPEEAS